MSRCPPVTVLSANHSGALRFHEAVAKQFTDDSAPDVGWLQPVVDAERPLILELDGERVALTGFVATCPARIEPCNGVQQNNKVRTTTDKSWPKLEVLPDGSDELAVNPLIALDELAKSEFPKTTQFAAATAVMMQAEPSTTAADRNTAAAADPDDFVHLWKIDLQSAYRFWHNHPHELWMYGKQWDGRGYLDCRTQFGDASMVQDFSRFTDYFLWLLRRLRDGDERLRSECSSFGASLWGAIDSVPKSKAYSKWREDRTEVEQIQRKTRVRDKTPQNAPRTRPDVEKEDQKAELKKNQTRRRYVEKTSIFFQTAGRHPPGARRETTEVKTRKC